MFQEPTSSFMADFGSPVIYGSQRTMAILDQPDSEILSQRVQTTGYRIEYPATDLLGLKHGDIVTIGVGPGWTFDAAGRLVHEPSSIQGVVASQFRVLGTPNMLDDGTFLVANLEKLS